jgi:ParB family chromosome partitioning protein
MSEEAPRKRPTGLGRGLSSLLGEVAQEAPLSGGERGGGVQMLSVGDIEQHPSQPRRHFDEEALDELAASIKMRGMIQPIVVKPSGAGRYQIVAGERRWRAAQRAQLHEVPVIIRDFSDDEVLEVALLENIQRQDLNAIEEADAYQRLIDQYGHTQDALAKVVNKSRSHVTNMVRLLGLTPPVKEMVARGQLSMGHARAILTAPDQLALAEDVIRRGLSVRDTEKLAGAAKPKPKRERLPHHSSAIADIEALERQLGDMLGLKVKIGYGPSGGSVTLNYSSLDQLDMICQRLSGEKI